MRRRVQATFVAASLIVGGAFADHASATVETRSHRPTDRVLGPDPLAVTAAAALDAWELYNALDAWTTESTAEQAAAFAEFIRLRDLVAAEAAVRLGIDPARMQTAWIAADRTHQLAVLFAFTQLGVPYGRLARKAGEAFDCSGITSWAWAQAGHEIPRASRWQMVDAAEVTQETAQAGDLVSYPGHVMMYLGVDFAVLHSPRTGSTVHLRNIWERKIPRLIWGNPLG
jgi:cell wall-associated NlpC family hydrolase